MKFLKKAVSALLAGITAVTMLFAGSVTAGAASDDVYVDGFYNTNGEYCIRVEKYGVSEYASTFDAISQSEVLDTNFLWLSLTLSFDNNDFLIRLLISYNDFFKTYVSLPFVNYGDGFDSNEKDIKKGELYLNTTTDFGSLIFLPKGSRIIEKLSTVKKVTLTGDIFYMEMGDEATTILSLESTTVVPNFKSLEKTSSVNKSDSSKDKPSTSGKLPKTAEKGTSMPEYTVEGYYTSKAKNIYEIIIGGIPAEEYEYLQACAAYFKDEGFTEVMVDSLGDVSFWIAAGISGDFSTAHLYFDSGYLNGEGKLEKSGDFCTWTLTFDLNSAAKKAIEKQIKKTKTGRMEVRNYYSISESGSYNHYNYYNGKNSYVSKTVKYNFSNEIKGKSSSASESDSAQTTLKTTTLTAKRSGEKITFSWDKVNGAEKYQIYYREKGESKYKKLANVSGSKTSYSTSKLDKSKTYQFIIRSYATSDGKKVYSKYSKVVTVK